MTRVALIGGEKLAPRTLAWVDDVVAEIERRGWSVVRWSTSTVPTSTEAPVDAWLAVSPDADLSALPLATLSTQRVAWVLEDLHRWAQLSHLRFYDTVVSDRPHYMARLRRRGGAEAVTELRRHDADEAALQLMRLLGPASRRAGGSSRPRPLYVHPDFSGSNPFQTMLFAQLPDVAVCPVAVDDVVDFLERSAESTSNTVLNLHWTNLILGRCATRDEAEPQLRRFVAALEAFKRARGTLIWTVHNELPHEAEFVDLELQLCEAVAAHADMVHLLSAGTADQIARSYRVDSDRCVVIPHSSYLGVYPDWISRGAARRRLGILSAEKVLLALGGVRAYKGLDRLLDVFETLRAEDPSLRLVVAGRPGGTSDLGELRARLSTQAGVTAVLEHIPDDQLQVFLRAADLAVLPYRAILNSGTYWLAKSFALPVVAPDQGALEEEADQLSTHLFDPTDDSSLEEVLRSAIDDCVTDPVDSRAARRAARSRAESRPPSDMARAFAEAVGPVMPATVE